MADELTMFWKLLRAEVPETAGEHDLAVIRQQIRRAQQRLEQVNRCRTTRAQDDQDNERYARLGRLLRACGGVSQRDTVGVRLALEKLA